MDLRFSSTLQLMLSLAYAHEQNQPVTSASLAKGLGVPSSFVRKLLAPLIKEGLVTATLGKGGGLRLTKTSDMVSIDEIYEAIYKDSPTWEQRSDIVHQCLVTRNIDNLISELNNQAHAAIKKTLAAWTLQTSLGKLKDIELVTAGK